MKNFLFILLSCAFLFTTRLAYSGIDYTDYRHEEWSHPHQGQNRDRESDRNREWESERERKYQHQNREVRDKTVKTIEHINAYPEKYIP